MLALSGRFLILVLFSPSSICKTHDFDKYIVYTSKNSVSRNTISVPDDFDLVLEVGTLSRFVG